jgi:hypothetical protein
MPNEDSMQPRKTIPIYQLIDAAVEKMGLELLGETDIHADNARQSN